MKILALEIETAGVEAEEFEPHLQAEAKAVWELYLAGVIRGCYFRADRHSAVLELECNSVEEARRALEGLPLVKEGLISFEMIPLAPYPGFGRLFTGS